MGNVSSGDRKTRKKILYLSLLRRVCQSMPLWFEQSSSLMKSLCIPFWDVLTFSIHRGAVLNEVSLFLETLESDGAGAVFKERKEGRKKVETKKRTCMLLATAVHKLSRRRFYIDANTPQPLLHLNCVWGSLHCTCLITTDTGAFLSRHKQGPRQGD